VSIASGMFVSVSPLPIVGDGIRNESFIRILLGTITFLCVATVTGWLAAELQNYLLGIFAIYQELNLVPQLSVWENMFLRKLLKKGVFIDKKAMIQDTTSIMEKMDYNIDPIAIVNNLPVSEKQMLQIMKALHEDVRILIFDEPSSSLLPKEVKKLFEIIQQLKKQGVGIIYISHRLEEIKVICERGTVLRNGEYVDTVPISKTTDLDKIVKMMVGHEIKEKFPKHLVDKGEMVLEIKDLCKKGFFEGIDVVGYAGEILGIFGLRGCGNNELARVIFGAEEFDEGEIKIGSGTNKIAGGDPIDAMRSGIFFLPADRKKEGLVLELSIKENVTLPSLANISKLGFILEKKEKSIVNNFIKRLGIKTPSLDALVKTLSGGNQQKVVIAKAMARYAKVLIFCEPTAGIDVGTRVEIYQLMNELVKEGCLIIMISSDLPEVLGISDRVLVMHKGRIQKEFRREEFSQEKILRSAFGELSMNNINREIPYH